MIALAEIPGSTYEIGQVVRVRVGENVHSCVIISRDTEKTYMVEDTSTKTRFIMIV